MAVWGFIVRASVNTQFSIVRARPRGIFLKSDEVKREADSDDTCGKPGVYA